MQRSRLGDADVEGCHDKQELDKLLSENKTQTQVNLPFEKGEDSKILGNRFKWN